MRARSRSPRVGGKTSDRTLTPQEVESWINDHRPALDRYDKIFKPSVPIREVIRRGVWRDRCEVTQADLNELVSEDKLSRHGPPRRLKKVAG